MTKMMKMMMKMVIPVAALLLLFTAGSTQAAVPADLYKSKCGMCHGGDGSGNTPMGKKLGLGDLRAPATQKQADAQLAAVIENGKGKMPGQKGLLPKGDIRQLVQYVRELAKKN